jgi:hypothetical protein
MNVNLSSARFVPISAPTSRILVSPILEKSSVHFGRSSENLDFAASINNDFSKADAQNLIASGRDVPGSDTDDLEVSNYIWLSE